MPGKRKRSSDRRIASLRVHNAEYNKIYREWRIEHKDDVGFYFSGDADLITWQAGRGFVTDSPEADERAALSVLASAMGKTLFLYTMLNILTLIIFKDTHMGGSFVTYRMGGMFSGNETAALILSYIINIAARLLPLIYLLRKVKMPMKLYLPLKVADRALFFEAIPMSLFIFGITSLLTGFSFEAFDFFGIYPYNSIWSPENIVYRILSLLLYTLILPLLSEVIHRGIFLHILRQFGDGCALIFTAAIAAMTASNVFAFMYTFAYSLVIGFFVMKTGSLLTAFVMRVIISCASYLISFVHSDSIYTGDYMLIAMIVIFACITLGLAFLIRFLTKQNSVNMPFFDMYVPTGEKILCMVSCPWIILWLAVTILYTLMCIVL